MTANDWWLILYFAGLLAALAVVGIRASRPPRPEVLTIEAGDMADTAKVTMRPLAAPADQPSITAYAADVSLDGTAQPTSAPVNFGDPFVFQCPDGAQAIVGWRYMSGSRLGVLGPTTPFAAVIPGPTLAPPAPEVQSIELAPASPPA